MGLLDMFGPPQGGGGLLDPSTYDPRMDIALGVAGQLLDNAGPSATRRGMFQGVPQALMQGRQGAFQRQVQQQQYADMLTASAERKRQAEARTKLGAYATPTYTREDISQPWQQQESSVDQDGLLAAWMDADPAGASKMFGNMFAPEDKVLGVGDVLSRGGQIIARGQPKPRDAPSGYEWGPDGKLRPMAGGPADTQGPFKGTGMDAQALGVVYGYESKRAAGQPTTPDEDYGYQLAKWQLTQPRVVGTPESGFYPINPPALPTRDAPAAPAVGGAAPPPSFQQPPAGPAPQAQGGPTVGAALTQPQGKPLSAEAQKQLTLANTAKKTLDAAIGVIAPEDSVDRILLGTMNGNVPFTAGRQVLGQLKEVIQNAVYLKSGAAAGQEEMNGYYQTYLPSTGDNDATVKDKLARLRSFLDQAASAARSRNGITDGAEPATAAPPPAFTPDVMRQMEEYWNARR
jgi:hypothetical protein